MGQLSATSQLPETKLRRLLVCLDRSTFSEVCVPYAVALAKTFGSAITLVHVMQPHHEGARSQTTDALDWEIARREARGYLEGLEREVSGSVGQPVEIRLEQGRPAQRIVDVANEIEADLTVLGSRGEGGGPAGSLGGTAQQVLAVARSSVFIAPSPSIAPSAVTPKRILVPLDGSLRTESVLPAAARIASTHGAEILLVHVVQEPLPTALLGAAEDMELARTLALRLEFGAKRYLDRLQQQLARENASVQTLVVRHASAHQCLLEISQREHADLIVLSAHGSACDSGQSFGCVTAYLLTHATIPLLVLQDLPGHELHRAKEIHATLPPLPPAPRASYAAENV